MLIAPFSSVLYFKRLCSLLQFLNKPDAVGFGPLLGRAACGSVDRLEGCAAVKSAVADGAVL